MDDAGTEIIKITVTVLELLKSSNPEVTTRCMIRKTASQKLEMDLSVPSRKKFVSALIDLYDVEQNDKDAAKEKGEKAEEAKLPTEEAEEGEENLGPGGGEAAGEYDDNGDLVVVRVSYR